MNLGSTGVMVPLEHHPISLPNNMCAPSPELSRVLGRIITAGQTQFPRDAQDLLDQTKMKNAGFNSGFKITEFGRSYFRQMLKRHHELKYVEQQVALEDPLEYTIRTRIENDYHELMTKHSRLQLSKEQSIDFDKQTLELSEVAQKDAAYASFNLPTLDSPRGRLLTARQNFLDSIEEGLRHLHIEAGLLHLGLRKFWAADSWDTVQLMGQSRIRLQAWLQKYDGFPQTQLKYNDFLTEQFRYHQFSETYLQSAIEAASQAAEKEGSSNCLTRIEFIAAQCLQDFVGLRAKLDELEPLRETHSIESDDVLAKMLSFASAWGKLKRIGLDNFTADLKQGSI